MTEPGLSGGPMAGNHSAATDAWGVPLKAVHCANCGEAHLVPHSSIPALCPLCHGGAVASAPADLPDGGPEQIVPFSISGQQAREILDRWTRGIWLRPAELTGAVLAGRLLRYWIPLWLVDAQVTGTWQGEAGFDYEVVSHEDRYADGAGWRSQEVTESRVRWEPRVGRINRRYDNVVAPALEDHRAVMDRTGGYDLAPRSAYRPEAVDGSAVRVPTLAPGAAWPQAEPAFVRASEDACRRAAGAQHMRGFTLQARYDDHSWTHLLLPAYTTWYEEDGTTWPVLINGQNGRVHGVRRASTRKANRASLVVGAVALVLFIVAALAALIGVAVPPLVIAGSVLLVVGVVIALLAPIPAIAAWVRNRGTSPDEPP